MGPDANLVIKIDRAGVGLKQHTEGHGGESRAMLEFSVGRLGAFKETVGGWLGVDGSRDAGHRPANCPAVLLSTTADRESPNRGKKTMRGFSVRARSEVDGVRSLTIDACGPHLGQWR